LLTLPPPGPSATARRYGRLSRVARLALRCRAVLLCLAGLAVLDLVVYLERDRWARYCPDDYHERLACCRAADADLVAVGASPVTEGIDPAILSGVRVNGRRLDRVCNLGLPGGTASEFWHAVRNGVRSPPAVLLYGSTASDINDGRQEPHGARSLMTWADLADWVRQRPRSAEWVSRQFLQARLSECWQLFHHRHAIRLWLADLAETHWPGSFPETAREAHCQYAYSAGLRHGDGFSPNPGFRDCHYDGFKAVGGREERFGFLEGYHVGEHLQQVHRLLDWCRQRGVTVIVVDMPVTVDLSDRLYPREFATYHQALGEVERAHGVRVIREARQGAGLTDHDFADLIHLNAGGARKFSSWLRGKLDDATGPGQGRGAR
jgi:hypothetical protein